MNYSQKSKLKRSSFLYIQIYTLTVFIYFFDYTCTCHIIFAEDGSIYVRNMFLDSINKVWSKILCSFISIFDEETHLKNLNISVRFFHTQLIPTISFSNIF